MYKPKRASVALFFTFFLLLGSLQWAAPIAAQTDPPTATTEATVAPPEEPTEVPPTEVIPTDVPPTEVVVPTETTAPEPTATTIPTEIVESTVTPTVPVEATTESSDFEAAAPINYFRVYLLQCEDTSRVGVTDFFYSGALSAAGEIGVNCIPVSQYISGAEVQITLNNSTESYVQPLNSSGEAYFYGDVVAGTYQVALLAGEEYTAVMEGTITLEPYTSSELAVVRYVEGGLTGPTEEGTTTVQGQFIYCLDPTRVGQVDLLFQTNSIAQEIDAAAEASECVQPNPGQGQLQLSDQGVGGIYTSQVVTGGDFYFSEVPYGNEFLFTDLNTGGTSAVFPIGGENGTNLNVTVYAYYAEEAPLLPVLQAQKIWCEDNERAIESESEFVIVNRNEFGASAESTCIVGYLPTDGVTLTLNTSPDGDFVAEGVAYGGGFDIVDFSPIQPGSYTLTETYEIEGVPFTATSESFTLAYGDYTQIQVINYIEEEEFDAPQGGDAFFPGVLLFCESEDRAGLLDFLVAEQSQPQKSISAQGTSTCNVADFNEGVVTLNYYGNGSSIPTEVVDTFTSDRGSGGYVYFGFVPAGFYQLVFADSSFPDGTYKSETFSLDGSGQKSFEILAYVDPVPSAELRVEKHFCSDPERDGETDFYVNDIPESESPPVPSLAAAADLSCRFADFSDLEDLDFTLTDTTTNQVITAEPVFSPIYGFYFPAVPAGTYVLTETWNGNVATSESITVDPATGYPYVFVYNYTSDPIDSQEGDPFVELDAFTCDTGSRGGEFDYFFYPQISSGGGDTRLQATSTENCRGANTGEYSFQLETEGEGDVSGAAVYPLTQDPDLPLIYYYEDDATDDRIPAGTYVVRETVTGSVSAPFTFGGFDNLVEFYFFQAAPTPTPTDVPGVPTATPTDVPGEPTATPTDVPGEPTATATTVPGEPTATATTAPGEPTATSDGNVDPGGDDDPDGDEDGDGTPNSDDPDFPGGVTQLPSTGQGSDQGASSALLIFLALAAALLLGGAIRTGRATRR